MVWAGQRMREIEALTQIDMTFSACLLTVWEPQHVNVDISQSPYDAP